MRVLGFCGVSSREHAGPKSWDQSPRQISHSGISGSVASHELIGLLQCRHLVSACCSLALRHTALLASSSDLMASSRRLISAARSSSVKPLIWPSPFPAGVWVSRTYNQRAQPLTTHVTVKDSLERANGVKDTNIVRLYSPPQGDDIGKVVDFDPCIQSHRRDGPFNASPTRSRRSGSCLRRERRWQSLRRKA